MDLRVVQKVWADLIKDLFHDGIKGHAKNLLLDELVENLIIDGSLRREVYCCANINWVHVSTFVRDHGAKLLDQESLEVVHTMIGNE